MHEWWFFALRRGSIEPAFPGVQLLIEPKLLPLRVKSAPAMPDLLQHVSDLRADQIPLKRRSSVYPLDKQQGMSYYFPTDCSRAV